MDRCPCNVCPLRERQSHHVTYLPAHVPFYPINPWVSFVSPLLPPGLHCIATVPDVLHLSAFLRSCCVWSAPSVSSSPNFTWHYDPPGMLYQSVTTAFPLGTLLLMTLLLWAKGSLLLAFSYSAPHILKQPTIALLVNWMNLSVILSPFPAASASIWGSDLKGRMQESNLCKEVPDEYCPSLPLCSPTIPVTVGVGSSSPFLYNFVTNLGYIISYFNSIKKVWALDKFKFAWKTKSWPST